MSNSKSPFSLNVNRREFLAGCAGCAAAATCAPGFGAPIVQSATAAAVAPAVGATAVLADIPVPDVKPRLRLVFTHISPDKETWPYKGYDYEGRKKELATRLQQACPNIEFLTATAQTAEDAKKILAQDRDIDGYVNYLVGCWTGATGEITASGRPTILVDDLYAGTGEFLTQYAAARRKGLKVAGVSSSRFEDVVEAVKTFEALKKMQHSVILDVIDRPTGEMAKAIEEVFGAKVRKTSGEELDEAFRKCDREPARGCADRWIREARVIVEPSREEIDKSAVMYVAMRDLLQKHRAQAIAIDCLTLFYGGKLAAYPCLGFFQLNNDGLVGACEADLESTVSMLLMTYLVGRPGYISDPVIDTSLNRIIYAHCVAPNKVFGPAGKANPYDIRSHSEDRKGASVRSIMPLGEIVTTLEFNPVRKEVIIHQGKTVENIDEDKACRTKLAAEVTDIDKLLTEWDQWGWHRVTFYGDLKRPVETVSALAGFKVIWEA
jgi:hypothetical protein